MRKRASYIYREIFRNAADGIIVINNKGKIIDANETYLSMTGYSLKDLLELTVFDLVVDAPETIKAEMEEVRQTGQLRTERLVRRKDGGIITADASVSYIKSRGGIFNAVVRDISDRKKMDSIREEYAALIAHDLRDPVMAMMLRINQLKQRNRTENDRKTLQAMEKTCERFSEMISEIAEAARQESVGMDHSGMYPVELNRLIASIITNDIPPEKRTRIRYFHPEHTVNVLGENKNLRRILTNLISNAMKYSPGEKSVEIHLGQKNGSAVLKIKDYGPGISKDEQTQIFEKFYRAKNSKAKYGFGLGLYITKLLVDAHHGEIKVESQPGHGTTFIVLLPLLKTE